MYVIELIEKHCVSLNSRTGLYKRYLDDILVFSHSKEENELLFEAMNNAHGNLWSTKEDEKMTQLPILISRGKAG